MPRRTERIEMTSAEFDEAVERAARLGAEGVLRELRSVMAVQLAGRSVVDRQMIAAAYSISTETVERWEERHGWPRVDGPNRRRVYYYWPDIVESVMQERLR